MENEQYLVSICVPVYGVETYIEQCAISLFEQTYQNIEYIFVNDCTPDKSIEILKSVINRYPNKKSSIHILSHEKNKGLGAARNTAVNAANGKFLMHVDSDDWLDTDCVQLCVDKQKETNADIVNFDAIKHSLGYTMSLINKDINSPIELTLAILSRKAFISIWGRLIRLSLYKDNRISVKEGVNMGEDYQITPKLIFHSKKVDYLHRSLYHYNCLNESSYCFKFSEEKDRQIWESADILTKYFQDKGVYYIDALNKGKINIYCNSRINACRSHNKKYFQEASRLIKQFNKKDYDSLSLPYQLTLKINNFTILKVALKIFTYIKHKKERQQGNCQYRVSLL